MTSEEYARLFGRHLLSVVQEHGHGTNDYPYKRLFTLGIQRIMFTGADEYEVEPDVQQVEVKPLGDLVIDVEEEITDLVAYCAAIAHRDPATEPLMRRLTALAVEQMQIIKEVKGEE